MVEQFRCDKCHRQFNNPEIVFRVSPAKVEDNKTDWTIHSSMLEWYICFDCIADVE